MKFSGIRAWPIRRQMLFLGICPALLILLFLGSYFVQERLDSADNALRAHGHFIARQLALASEYSVIAGNIDDMENLVGSMLDDPDVHYVSISDVNGTILFDAHGKGIKQDDLWYFSEKILQAPVAVADLSEPVLLSGNVDAAVASPVVGEVLVALSTDSLRAGKNEILLASLLPALVTLALTIFLALQIAGIIVDPVIRLSQVARKIKQNDYTVRVQGTTGGEIGNLETDINDMAIALQEAETNRKQLLEKMRVATEQAELASQAKSDFLAMMSHEIRTPMNGVLGMLQLLETTPLSSKQAEYAKVATQSTHHLLEVIKDILDFSRMERGELSVEPACFRLYGLMENLASSFRYSAEQKGLRFDFIAEGELNGLQVMSDPTRLQQVVVNLVGNALKFTEKGFVRLRVSAHHREPGFIAVVIVVEDSGPGIPEEKQEKVFQPFLQADNSISRQYGGTGLGLAIARQLTELLGGSISLTSRDGAGSLFRCDFRFPICREEVTQEIAVQPDFPGSDGLSKARILLVEDNSVNRMVATEMLRMCGVELDVAEDGLQACSMYRPAYYRCIFMDVQMPGMDGLDATRAIRKMEEEAGAARTPIIALTAYALSGERQRCQEAGMDDYLSKPFRQAEIQAKLESWLKG